MVCSISLFSYVAYYQSRTIFIGTACFERNYLYTSSHLDLCHDVFTAEAENQA